MTQRLPKPDKTYRWGKWRCSIYTEQQMAMLTRTDGKVYIIKKTTESVGRIPEYIKERLWRIGFLTQWREEQLRRTATRLKDLANKHERFVRTEQLRRG